MPKDHPILDYSKPPRRSGVVEGLRVVIAVLCAFATFIGVGVIGFGAGAFVDLSDVPTRDMPSQMFAGSLVCLIGLIIVVVSARWLINAVWPKRNTP
jgi:hypothetical protein